MRILITGSKGQLGHELIDQLKKMCSPLGTLPDVYQDAQVTAIDIDELDISDLAATMAMLCEVRPDVIFNCAAMTNVDGCETNQDIALKANALGPRNIAMAAQRIGARLVHVSTDYVFAGDGSTPRCEWDRTDPKTIYGKSKLLGEEFVRQQCPCYFIVRTAWLYGTVGNNFVRTIARIAREKGELKVVNDQRGNPTNAADLAHHLLLLAATEEYGTYHCTGEGECSWYDFACEILRLADIPCRIAPCTTEENSRPARRPAYSSLDNMMLRNTVGNHMRPWREALEEFIERTTI